MPRGCSRTTSGASLEAGRGRPNSKPRWSGYSARARSSSRNTARQASDTPASHALHNDTVFSLPTCFPHVPTSVKPMWEATTKKCPSIGDFLPSHIEVPVNRTLLTRALREAPVNRALFLPSHMLPTPSLISAYSPPIPPMRKGRALRRAPLRMTPPQEAFLVLRRTAPHAKYFDREHQTLRLRR